VLPEAQNDQAIREAILARKGPEWQKLRTLANFIDYMGGLVRHDLVEREFACDLWFAVVVRSWEALAPTISSLRQREGGIRLWEDFEYLVLLCRRFRARFPHGTYPKGEEAVALPPPWPEALT